MNVSFSSAPHSSSFLPSSMAGMLEDFDDDVAGLVATEDRPFGSADPFADISGVGGMQGVDEGGIMGGPPDGLLRRRKLSEAVKEAAAARRPVPLVRVW